MGRTGAGWIWFLAGLVLAGFAFGCGEPTDDAPGGPGPWPTDALKDYSRAYALGTPKSVGIDDGYNLWLLDDDRIGVLRPGDPAPKWTSAVGQGAEGFVSTVVCGGAAGKAYVGYLTHDLENPSRATEREKAMGDADLVKLEADGTISLEKHFTIVNTNDPRFDETRSVLACAKVMRGALKGEVYFGTNHGVTRVRGDEVDDHRHVVFRYPEPNGSLHIGYNWAVSITQDGGLFLGNEWKIGLLTPPAELHDFHDATRAPWKLDTFVEALGSELEMDYWRATAQTRDGRYFLASREHGLWELQLSPRRYTRVEGLPTRRLTALAATDDGSLFIGTAGSGVWRQKPDGSVERVSGVEGAQVKQLVYDPTVTNPMLLVLTDAGVFVLRGN